MKLYQIFIFEVNSTPPNMTTMPMAKADNTPAMLQEPAEEQLDVEASEALYPA